MAHKDGGPHVGGYGITEEISREYGKKGKVPETWWPFRIAARSKTEYLGYPTQKPIALLERIVKAGSNEKDVVLDPFCGCATTCMAAEKWGRNWIGIDISHKAYELVNERIEKLYTEQGGSTAFHSLLSGKRDKSGKTTFAKAIFTTTPPRRGVDDPREQGYVYIISNDNWQGIFKVGIAKNPQARLNSYQTSDPYRAYKLLYKHKTPHYKAIEQHIHKKFKAANEWVEGDFEQIKKAIKSRDKKLHGE